MPIDMGIGGALIGAGSSLIGGLLGNRSQKRYNRQQQATAMANINLQKAFAKQGIRWRVADAKAAGLHPLAALGANTSSFFPVSVGGGAKDYDYLGKMGQGIGSAISGRKSAALDLEEQQEKIKNMKLVNAGLAKSLVSPVSGGTESDPYGLVTGSGQADSVQAVTPVTKERRLSDAIGVETGMTPLESKSVDQQGYVWYAPTTERQEMLESSIFDQGKYLIYRGKKFLDAVHYYYNPNAKGAKEHRALLRRIRPHVNRPGYEWRFNPWRGFKEYPKKNMFYEKSRQSEKSSSKYNLRDKWKKSYNIGNFIN